MIISFCKFFFMIVIVFFCIHFNRSRLLKNLLILIQSVQIFLKVIIQIGM